MNTSTAYLNRIDDVLDTVSTPYGYPKAQPRNPIANPAAKLRATLYGGN